MNLPNLITFSRLILAFVVVFAFVFGGEIGRIIACASFFIASVTDWLDGYIARKYNLITNLGKLMDPLADKILVAGGLVTLTSVNLVPAWATFLILFREFGVSGLRQVATEQNIVLAADNLGKVKTVIQLLGIFYIMLIGHCGCSPLANQITVYLMVGITLFSGGNYFWKNRQLFQK